MAAYMTINARYASWRELYLSKKKDSKGFGQEPIKFEDSLSSTAPWSFVNDPTAFEDTITTLKGKSFLLLPAGGNRVNLVHDCFCADVDDDKGSSVFGILGSRGSSPFKRINVGQAVLPRSSPRVTRSEERKESLTRSPLKDLAKYSSADEFRDLFTDPGGKGLSESALRKEPQSFFVGRSVFELF